MPVRSAATMVTVLVGFVVPATPAAADTAMQQTETASYALTTGRLWSLVAVALGLIGLAAGAFARTRFLGGPTAQRRNAFLALTAGLAGSVLAGTVVVFADGGPGSGSGVVGGYLALLIGLLATTSGVLRLRRSGQIDRPLDNTSRA